MAKALLCPDCGHRHPLDSVGEGPTFRCVECRRLLKVPAGVVVAPSTNGKAGRPDTTRVLEPQATAPARIPPSQRGDVVREQARRARAGQAPVVAGRVPRLARVAVWLFAVPVGLAVVLVVGRVTGAVDVDDAVDVYIGVGLDRFLGPLLLLPVWAAVSATVAHVLLEAVERWRTPGGGRRPGAT